MITGVQTTGVFSMNSQKNIAMFGGYTKFWYTGGLMSLCAEMDLST